MSFQVINSYHISRMYKLFLAPFFPRDFFFPGLFAEEKQLFLVAIIYGCFCCVTANRCRPYLVTPVEDYNNYINAVFLNVSFSRAPAYRFWH